MRKFLPFIISVFVIMFNNVSVFAADNTLRGVDVVKKDNSYTIELTSRAPIQYTKTIVSANRVLINLKDVGISKNIVDASIGTVTCLKVSNSVAPSILEASSTS